MARQLVEKYIFSPNAAGSGTVKFPGKVDLTQLLIIANIAVARANPSLTAALRV